MKDPNLSRRALFAAGLSAACLPARAFSQEVASFSVDVQLIQIGFSVRDAKGNLVQGLSQRDFEVYETGRKQDIKVFSREEELPLTLALVVDRSGSQDEFEQENIYSAVTFFRSILRPQDRAMIVAFNGKVKLIQDLTASLDTLEASLREMPRKFDRAPLIGPNAERVGGSAVLDAAFWTLQDKIARAPGRKAVIMIGDGKDNGSVKQLIDLVDMLQSNDILFYGLDNAADDPNDNRRIRSRMPLIANESGGRVFNTQQMTLRKAFDEIEQELRTMYTLAYTPTNPDRSGRYRKVEVRPVNRTLLARARPGYHSR